MNSKRIFTADKKPWMTTEETEYRFDVLIDMSDNSDPASK